MEINDFDKFVILINKLKEIDGIGWKIDNISLQYAPNQINIRLIKIKDYSQETKSEVLAEKQGLFDTDLSPDIKLNTKNEN